MSSKDQAQRAVALAVDSSFIVQAPAGSGKTELLTQRFLKLLSLVDKPERVLAITFTRKATQEMRERILERLRQATPAEMPGVDPGAPQSGSVAVPEHERIAVEFATAVCKKDQALGWQLLRNPARLQIHTIDGLCARIAGMLPTPGEGVPGLQVTEDAQPLYQKAARRMIEDVGERRLAGFAYASLTRLLVHLQGDAMRLQDLLSAMLGRRDQWLTLLSEGGANTCQAMQKRQRAELDCLTNVLGHDSLRELSASLLRLTRGADDMEQAAGLRAALQASAADPQNEDLQVRGLWQALSVVATQKCAPFAAGSIQSRVLPGGGGEGRGRQVTAIKDIVSGWREDDIAQLVFQRWVKSPPLGLSTEQHGILEDCIVLLRVAEVELRLLFAQENRTDFQYVTEMAMKSLGQEERPGDALLYADYRLSHILMDEFQDTSHMQYKLLQRLTSGWQAGDGRSLFLVGDPMQSIYRFRKADVALFKQVFAQGRLGDIRLKRLQLSSNFRSRKEVINWVNEQFQHIFKQLVSVSPGAVGYTRVDAERDMGGKVLAHPWPVALGDAHEASLVADLISRTQARHADTSIAVLGRGRKHLEMIARELKSRDIRYEAVKVEALSSRPVIQDLLMILRAILHPRERIAWLALLRAPWVGLTPAQLHLYADLDEHVDPLTQIRSEGGLQGLDGAMSGSVSRFLQVLSEVLAARGRLPLHRLVEVAWIRLGGPYVIGSQPELDNAQSFFRLLAEVESEQPEDVNAALMSRMENFYSGSIASKVKLMTIHGAKGLEFDVVILPGLHKAGGHGDAHFLRIEELQFDDGTDAVLMAPIRGREDAGPDMYNYLYALNSEQEAFEAQRVLYVAATRAKESLHVFGGWKMMGPAANRAPACNSGTFMKLLWPFFEAAIDPADANGAVDDQATTPPLLPFLRLENAPQLALEPAVVDYQPFNGELRIPERDALALGDATHLWLELLHDYPPDEWSDNWLAQRRPALAASLINAGARIESTGALQNRLEQILSDVMASASGRDIALAAGKSASWAELPFYTRDGVRLKKNIIDRLYLNHDGRYVIVDYKTGSDSDASQQKWNAQLDLYKTIVEAYTGAQVSSVEIFRVGNGSKHQ